MLQLVPLERSALKGATMNIPAKPFDLDPDWEVDPESLEVGAKIGAHQTPQAGHGILHTLGLIICILCTDKTLCPAAMTLAGQEDRACQRQVDAHGCDNCCRRGRVWGGA